MEHGSLHRLHIGQTHKLPSFLGRAIYFNVSQLLTLLTYGTDEEGPAILII